MSFGEALFLRSFGSVPRTVDWRFHSTSPWRHLRISPVCGSRLTLSFKTEKIGGGGAFAAGDVRQMLQEFDPTISLSEAITPPSSWYTDPSFLALEFERVFFRGWQVAGFVEQVKSPNDFFTGRLGNVEFVVCRDASGELRAFHNVCRHHASVLASGSGQRSCFECPYHGWTYGLDGLLLRATRITGIKNFNKNNFGLLPLNVASWGPFVLINVDKNMPIKQKHSRYEVGNDWLGSASKILSANGIDTSLEYICRRKYTIECNWKVFCDNYLDGGYHVVYAHGGLASGLKLDSYNTSIYENVSIQSCETAAAKGNDIDRLGSKAFYVFVYPNFMINRYGPWMDTNLAFPLGPNKCQVIFDYFLDPSMMNDEEFIESSLKESEIVQMEDITLCEGVQKGLESPAYCSGSSYNLLLFDAPFVRNSFPGMSHARRK
ncbi:choline monooxygenase, chloroplastic [Phalaenopsis equestris]|uniref:choline monooxygenase, chloroplastic n=1 Tax=Phalaenopsis equestris TaxID=78828 RepID=UPI0009E2BE19|nr:choline monooxygenase, chloroplastic [Phalaenopsis equestris]